MNNTLRSVETLTRQLAAIFAGFIVLWVLTGSWVAVGLTCVSGWAFFYALGALHDADGIDFRHRRERELLRQGIRDHLMRRRDEALAKLLRQSAPGGTA